jgi:hypothetical protein
VSNPGLEAGERSRARRLAAMTPDERVSLALWLREEGLTGYMATHGVDRRTAIAQIQATRRLGRRRSACATADAP